MGWAFAINISLSVFESGCMTGKLYLPLLLGTHVHLISTEWVKLKHHIDFH